MTLRRRRFSRDFKVQILREIEAGKTPAQAVREHQVSAGMIVSWRKQYEQYGERAFQGNGHTYTSEAKIAELERMIGQLTVDNALLKKALSRLETQSAKQNGNGGMR